MHSCKLESVLGRREMGGLCVHLKRGLCALLNAFGQRLEERDDALCNAFFEGWFCLLTAFGKELFAFCRVF